MYLIKARRLHPDLWALCSQYIRPQEYREVVEEREGNLICGYCFCDRPIQSEEERQLSVLSTWRRPEDPLPIFRNRENPNIFHPVARRPEEVLNRRGPGRDLMRSTEFLSYCSEKCFIDSKLLE